MTDFDVVCVVGTRPEIIKMAPVIRALSDSPLSVHLVHTNQHYDRALSWTFFETLELPTPDTNLHIGSGSQGTQTAAGLTGIEALLLDHDPKAVLAQGDTNAVLSAALAASKLPEVVFGHVEAGIRSYDRTMPEEVNRVVADDVAHLLFAPTETARENLSAEGITDGVHVTGNTVVDACREHVALADERATVHADLDLTPGEYVAATLHRPGNTDDPERLRAIVEALDGQAFPVVLPAHPRTRGALAEHGIEPSGSLRLVDPIGYLDFLALLRDARAVVTDSGGIQEEASILDVPCLTVRPNTERPETVEAGVNELIEPAALADRLATLYADPDEQAAMRGAPDLYGDGTAGRKIVALLEERL